MLVRTYWQIGRHTVELLFLSRGPFVISRERQRPIVISRER
ncbi:MAG: hypothetical protein KatS3mg058_2659 [Roseiflexus sp.]|nr:MAG: hypothetical protein KatS3mg058_2659 [Roseiflexus sp.]